jgi:dTDP-4-amino-4,6-dideoxy-D-galactose acyltransferase
VEESNLADGAPCALLTWDSEFWGFPVGRFDGSVLDSEKLESVLEWCAGNQIRCLYFAADGTDAETLQRTHGAGFQFVDVRVDLELTGSNLPVKCGTNPEVRRVVREEVQAIQKIARQAHHETRFFKDLNFDRSKCEELYARWIHRDFESGNILGYFPNKRQDAGGYITLAMESPGCARIGLIAVEKTLRGQGAGSQLLDAALRTAVEMGAKKIRVATQGTNVPALKLYEKAGFRVRDVKIWFHRWFPARELTPQKKYFK